MLEHPRRIPAHGQPYAVEGLSHQCRSTQEQQMARWRIRRHRLRTKDECDLLAVDRPGVDGRGLRRGRKEKKVRAVRQEGWRTIQEFTPSWVESGDRDWRPAVGRHAEHRTCEVRHEYDRPVLTPAAAQTERCIGQ